MSVLEPCEATADGAGAVNGAEAAGVAEGAAVVQADDAGVACRAAASTGLA